VFDVIIKDGTVVDGTGAAPRVGTDVAVEGGQIVAVGEDLGPARRTIDADGRLVTPGFVDLHTHYDGQVSWDPVMAPSSIHGVTTAVIGNCGVGFAPAAPDRREWLIQLMEGVEDIPGSVLEAGINWDWETFPEYLDALDRTPRTIDIAAQVPHGAVRAYVMGERGAENRDPTDEDLAAMARLVEEAMRAGAVGFTTSRVRIHRAKDGECVPGTFATPHELKELGRAMARGGYGVYEVSSDYGLGGIDGEFSDDMDWMSELSVETGMPVFYLLEQVNEKPDEFREILRRAEARNAEGAKLYAMTAVRSPGILMSLEGSMHPFAKHPTFMKLAGLPLPELVAEMRKSEVRAQILSEQTTYLVDEVQVLYNVVHGFDTFYPLGDPPNYEPAPEDSVGARARALGRDPYDYCYDLLLEDDGHALLFMAIHEFIEGTLDSTLERMRRDDCVVSLSDAGAHARSICDASVTTFMLTHWARDRVRGPRLTVEEAVKLQTHDTAALYGFFDRGVIAPGYRADLNVIDFDGLRLHAPRYVFDFPTGAGRLLQQVDGYEATMVAGQITFENGEHTGALPGRLVRGGRRLSSAGRN